MYSLRHFSFEKSYQLHNTHIFTLYYNDYYIDIIRQNPVLNQFNCGVVVCNEAKVNT